MKTSNVQRPTSNVQSPRPFTGAQCFHPMFDVPLRLALIIITLTAAALAEPPIRLISRKFPNGISSWRMIDPSERKSTETFYDMSGRLTHRIVSKLDDRLAPVSAIMYNAKGVIYQKSAYKTDGENRVIQEVIYGPKDNLIGTNNYTFIHRNGGRTEIRVDTYDSNGNLIQAPRLSKPGK